ncbi:MAG TPA: hypothetical protein PLG17_11155, partial [Thermodesulfobacteriota bacterium]|nr:hypothetical protein [Thermodesulfobacteriota bacterium]
LFEHPGSRWELAYRKDIDRGRLNVIDTNRQTPTDSIGERIMMNSERDPQGHDTEGPISGREKATLHCRH